MTVTAVAQPLNAPPRIAVTVTSAGGATITAIGLTRTAQGVTEVVRIQPTAGPSPRIVNDPEPPWGVPVVYTATYTTAGGTAIESSAAVTLSPDRPWAVHPTAPALSVCLDSASPTTLGVRSHGAVSRAASDTAHQVIGARFQTYSRTGPRSASRTSLEVGATTDEEVDALWALIDDLTPILIRVPSSWHWNWEDGYYRVGDVDANRVVQYGPDSRRVFTLPLERVEAPAGSQQAERTYGKVLGDFATYNAAAAAYATYTDAVTDTRR